MGRLVVTVCRSLVVFAMLLSVVAGVSQASTGASGANTLSFKFDICPEGGDCYPYANTDAWFYDVAAGVETLVTNDAAGWASFSGLADGEYAFYTPSVAQKSVTITCVDANGAAVASWEGANGPTVALAGGQSVSCTGVMVPFGPADQPDYPENSLTFRSMICPADSDICTPYAPALAQFTPGLTGITATIDTDAEGWAYFGGLGDGDYGFNNPMLKPESYSTTCVDADGNEIPVFWGDLGRTVTLSGDIAVTCTTLIVPNLGPSIPVDELNSLTFRAMICPEWSDICTPYSPAEARFVDGLTLAEQIVPVDDQGWASFSGLIDGDYGFSTPMVQPKSVTVDCVDPNGITIPTFDSDLGLTISLAGGVDATCSIFAVPNGQGPVESGEPTTADVPSYVTSYVVECPAGYTGTDYAADCGGTPSRTYTAYLAWGGVPDLHTAQQDANAAGSATFEVTPEITYSLWPGTEAIGETIVAVDCITFDELDEDGMPIGQPLDPPLGGTGYEIFVNAGHSVECTFVVVPDATDTTGSGSPEASASASSLPVTVAIVAMECPDGYDPAATADCVNVADASIYTGRLGYGTVPQGLVSIDAEFNDYAYASFDDLDPGHYSVILAADGQEIAAVSCEVVEGINDEEPVYITPPQGSRGYEIDAPVDGGVICTFFMVAADQGGGEPTGSDEPTASHEPTGSDEPTASHEPTGSDKPAASGKPAASTAGAITLPNTGAGAAIDADRDLVTLVAGLMVILAASASLGAIVVGRRPADR